jgi:hypothetical protein
LPLPGAAPLIIIPGGDDGIRLFGGFPLAGKYIQAGNFTSNRCQLGYVPSFTFPDNQNSPSGHLKRKSISYIARGISV